MSSVLSQEEKSRIASTIAEVETTTSGEIVVAVLPQSAEYAAPRALAALVLALVLGVGLHLVLPELDTSIVLLSILPLALVTYLLFGAPALHRLLIPRAAANELTHKKALELFASQGLYRTRDNTGVLIFVSELEHRVVLLGDRAIDAVMTQEGWQRELDVLVGAVKQGRAAEGLVTVVRDVGERLAKHFPRKADDTNELSNEVVDR